MILVVRRSLLGLALVFVAGFTIAAVANLRTPAPTDFTSSRLLAEAPAPLTQPTTLRVVTWNLASAYLFTGNRHERTAAVARMLRELDPDLVGLQEAFVASEREDLLADLAGTRLSHQARFPAALVGNGLWILSAHPIEEAWFHRYAHSNPWYRVFEGDWWAGKGAGLARVRLPGGALVDLFDTHAQAGRGNPDNEQVRLGQMRELARFVNNARSPGAPGFVVGDFNTRRNRPDYQALVDDAGLERTMTLDSEIDHVFGVGNERYRYHVLDTRVIEGTIPSAHPELFLDRAPSPREWLAHHFGARSETHISDHPGYLVTVRIEPVEALAPAQPVSAEATTLAP